MMENVKVKDKMTLDEMRELLNVDKVERARNASLAIQQALQKYGCALHTVIEYDQHGNIVSLQYKTISL